MRNTLHAAIWGEVFSVQKVLLVLIQNLRSMSSLFFTCEVCFLSSYNLKVGIRSDPKEEHINYSTHLALANTPTYPPQEVPLNPQQWMKQR